LFKRGFQMKKIVLIGIIVFLVSSVLTYASSNNKLIQNLPLETAIRKELNIPSRDLTQDDLEKVKTLFLTKDTLSLTGIEKLKNLQQLFIFESSIHDLSPIANLYQLETLSIDQSPISDINALSKLENLDEVHFDQDQIRDISPLAASKKLTTLVVTNNLIQNINVLAGMQRLMFLLITNNQIKDLSPLSQLQYLNQIEAGYNQIESIDSIKNFKGSVLHLNDNKIQDMTALTYMSDLDDLNIRNNPLNSDSKELIQELKTNQIIKFDSDEIKIKLNGEIQSYNISPIKLNGNTLVPMRAIFEQLGASIFWDDVSNTVTAKKGDIKVSTQIGSIIAKINDNTFTLLTSPTIINGSTMVPLRFVSEALGAKVDWDASTKTVSIISND
jgi:internalin A